MRYYLRNFSVFIFIFVCTNVFSKDMTLNELFFDDSKPYHLKILEALPKHAIVQIGPDDAENTVIEFMDYFCGYCKKIHPELIDPVFLVLYFLTLKIIHYVIQYLYLDNLPQQPFLQLSLSFH